MNDDDFRPDDVVLPEDLLQEDEDIYIDDQSGELDVSGDNMDLEADDDTGEMIEDVLGQEPKPGIPYSMADEIEVAELKRRGLIDDDDLEDNGELAEGENDDGSFEDDL